MELRFYLDGVLYDDPIDYNDLTITVERDESIKGLIKKFTNKFTFVGPAYTYLNDLKNLTGFCAQVDCEIQYQHPNTLIWTTLFTGFINVVDIRFTHYPVYNATVVVEDNAFTTLINNNKKIKTRVQGLTKSKNGETITTVTPVSIDFFDSLTGTYNILNITSYNVSECFRFLIAFMTDGQVDYESPLFESGGDLDHIYLTNGSSLNHVSSGTGYILTISFEELFTEMNKRFNISFEMDYSGARPKIIIDRTENLFLTTISETLNDPNFVDESYDKAKLYSVIKFGGEHIVNDGTDASVNFPEEPFIGFRKEEYNLLGQCNVDVTLDLTQNWISDHNIIHVVVKDLVTSYDENIFVFEADPADLTKARQYDIYNPGTAPYFYNIALTNQSIALNYFGGVPGPIASYLSDSLNTFTAGLTTDYFLVDGVIIWDKDTPPEGIDLGTNYDTATGRYTAAGTGAHALHTRIRVYFDIAALTGVAYGTEIVKLYFRRYSAADVFIEEAVLPSIYYTPGVVGFSFNVSLFMNIGEYVTMEADAIHNAAYISINDYFTPPGYSVFECTSAPDEGGVYMEYDSGDYRIIDYEFEYPLTLTQMTNILANESKRIEFTLNNRTFGGWIKKIEFKIRQSMADIILVEKQNQLP